LKDSDDIVFGRICIFQQFKLQIERSIISVVGTIKKGVGG